ncbi:stage V sporulation protein AE [Tissierella praeacuta]|uniref:Stage V sporulation protein AE n=1 Tax=Tissierella praeacuta DSM 18095 TaxID=1123404 RepID=A0A1M4SWV7_9FIRM|nr:stage V sporulation protein AE [Tissierella praeacuta]TCU70738.1 stage V sporulation protein AE [Tissierella praeacuta]SHE36706.1 stage V sporulation protein AE [Tissierella praeacuta DSM 18095]SUP01849.1 stage V sporulation protein AE [Tissierella praeacuta]HAE92107.1 stage V sporulation protein AE [Tissierella sp.]
MEYIKAFIVGGLICVIGQVILDNTKWTPAHILVSFLTAGVILGGIGVYKPLVKFAGAGATVPIVGFGNALAEGAIEGAKTKGVIGAFTGGLQATAGGVAAAILFGYIMALVFNPKTKN